MRIRIVPTMRDAIDSILVLGGVVIIVLQVLAIAYSRIQMAVVAVGVMMIYLGVWRLGSHALPTRRIYQQLRSEVDHFLTLVRKLNTHAIRGESALVDDTRAAMHQSVDQMPCVSGVSDKES